MPRYEVIPGAGIDRAMFGETRDVLRSRFGNSRTFRRGGSGPLSDQFIAAGLILRYDDDDRLAAIEIGHWVEAEACYQGIELMDRPFTEVVRDLRDAGVELVMADSCSASGAGIHLSWSAAGEPDAVVDWVCVDLRGLPARTGDEPRTAGGVADDGEAGTLF